MRQRKPVTQRILQKNPQDLAISVVTAGELLIARHKGRDQAQIDIQLSRLFPYVRTVALSAEVAATYAVVRAHFEGIGQIIGANDLWIAAHALALNCTLVTNNEDEFRRVPNLRIENWTRPE